MNAYTEGFNMSLDEKLKKGIIGESVVKIIGTAADYAISRADPDFGGVDFHVKKIDRRRGTRQLERGMVTDLQVKTSSNWKLNDGHVVYPLESKTFNDMVQRAKFG